MSTPWTPEPFEADDGSVPFEGFIEDLSDFKFAALDAAIQVVLAERGIDLAKTEWLKPLDIGRPVDAVWGIPHTGRQENQR
jgi:hypothetical protein